MTKYLLGLFCALFLFACTSDDEDSGKIAIDVDGLSFSFSARMEPWNFFDYENRFGRPCVGYMSEHGFQFTYLGTGVIGAPEYYKSATDFAAADTYSALPGYETNLEVDNNKLIKGTFSGDFQNPEGAIKHIEGRFTIRKSKIDD